MTFGFSDGSRNFRKLFSVSWNSRFARVWLCPLSSLILYHDCVSVIVSRSTSFIENFVICCYQVTKLFCSRYCFASALPARSPCNLGSLGHFAISFFREVTKDTVPPRHHFSWTFRIWILRSVCGCVPWCWHSFIFKISCEILWPFWQLSQRVSRCPNDVPVFICLFEFL